MNRRDAIKALTTLPLVPGSSLAEVPSEPKPLCFVLSPPPDGDICYETAERIIIHWSKLFPDGPPIIILPAGTKLEMAVDPRKGKK